MTLCKHFQYHPCKEAVNNMNTIKLENILSYCDGITRFLGKDASGNLYMAAIIKEDDDMDKFFAVGCTEDQYLQYINLRIDLYDVVINRKSTPIWYKVDVLGFDYSCDLELQEQDMAFPDEYLPYRPDLDALRKVIQESEMKNREFEVYDEVEVDACESTFIDAATKPLMPVANFSFDGFNDSPCSPKHTPHQGNTGNEDPSKRLAA